MDNPKDEESIQVCLAEYSALRAEIPMMIGGVRI
jgi:hypothetical protein